MAKLAQAILTRSETRFYETLRALTRQADPARFLWQVLNSRPAVEADEPTLWLVPSASREGVSYQVDIDARTCSCSGFRFRHRCPHLAVADFAVRLLFELSCGGHDSSKVKLTPAPAGLSVRE